MAYGTTKRAPTGVVGAWNPVADPLGATVVEAPSCDASMWSSSPAARGGSSSGRVRCAVRHRKGPGAAERKRAARARVRWSRAAPSAVAGRDGNGRSSLMASRPTYDQSKQVAEAGRETEWTRPSFGRELFLGRFRLDLIHPQPELDPSRVRKGEAFLERLRAFLTERVDRQRIEREAEIPADVVQGLADLGALGMKIPEEYGGLGLSQVHYNKALAMAGTWHSAISTLLSAHQSIGLPEPLRLFGSEEQKREWLPKLARDHVSAFLLTEPDVGSDPARMTTAAIPTDDGTGYRITGTKLWATNGAIADVVVIMAETRNEFMGLRGIENSLTRLEDVFVPRESVIGGEGMGLKIALATLNTGRLSLPAICAALTRYSLKIAREWSVERRQWGKPIGEHDPVAQKLAFIAGS